MSNLFEDLSGLSKEERIRKLTTLFYSGVKGSRSRKNRFQQINGFGPDLQLPESESKAFRQYKVFTSSLFCKGEASREGLFLGIIHGIMLQRGYSMADILDAQAGNEESDAAKEERRLAEEILNCFPDQDPASLTPEQIQQAGEKFGVLFAEGMKGFSNLNLNKELEIVMSRTGAAGMTPLQFSHTPEGMLWTSAILDNARNAVQEFSQQLGRSYDSSSAPVLNSPDSPYRGVRKYFTSMNRNLTAEDYSRFYSMHNFFTGLVTNKTSSSIQEAYAKANGMERNDGMRFSDNRTLLKKASYLQEMSDLLLNQGNKNIGECQLPITGPDYFTEKSWEDQTAEPSNAEMLQTLETLPDYRKKHLKLKKEDALYAAGNHIRTINQGLLRETPETVNRAIQRSLLPGQKPEQVSNGFLRLRAPFTLNPEDRKIYMEAQGTLIVYYTKKNEEHANGGEPGQQDRTLLELFDITREELKRTSVFNLIKMPEQDPEKIAVPKTTAELQRQFSVWNPEKPEDGFGDVDEIHKLYKDCPDPEKEGRLMYERLLDRFEAFDPFLPLTRETERDFYRHVRSFRYLQNQKIKDPKGYAAAMASRYPTVEARARFAEKAALMNAAAARLSGGLPEAYKKAVELYQRAMLSLDAPEPEIYTGNRHLALHERIPALKKMQPQLESILGRKLSEEDLEQMAYNPKNDAIRVEARDAADWHTRQKEYLHQHYPEYKDQLHNLDALAALYLNTSGTAQAEADNRALLNALSAQSAEGRIDFIRRAAADLIFANQENFGQTEYADKPLEMLHVLRKDKRVLGIAAELQGLLRADKQENALSSDIRRILEDRSQYYSNSSLYEYNLSSLAGESGWLLMNMQEADARKLKKYLVDYAKDPEQGLNPNKYKQGSAEQLLAHSLLTDIRSMYLRNAGIGTEYLDKDQLTELAERGGLDLDKHAVDRDGEDASMMDVALKHRINCKFETYRSPDLAKHLEELKIYQGSPLNDGSYVVWNEHVNFDLFKTALQNFRTFQENAEHGLSACTQEKQDQFHRLSAAVRSCQILMENPVAYEEELRALYMSLQNLKNKIYAFRTTKDPADQAFADACSEQLNLMLEASNDTLAKCTGLLEKHHIPTDQHRIPADEERNENKTLFDPSVKLTPEESSTYAWNLWRDRGQPSTGIMYLAKINPLSPDDMKRIFVYDEKTGKMEQPFALKEEEYAGYPDQNLVPHRELLKKYFNIDYLRSHPVFVYEPGQLFPGRLTMQNDNTFALDSQLDAHLPLKFSRLFQERMEQRRKEIQTETALHNAENFAALEEEGRSQLRKVYGPERPQPEQVEKKLVKSYIERILYNEKGQRIQNTKPVSNEILKVMTPDAFTALTIAASFTEKVSAKESSKRLYQIAEGDMILASVTMHRDGYARHRENDQAYGLALEAADGIVKKDYSKAGELLAEGISNYTVFARFMTHGVNKVNEQLMGDMRPSVQLLELLEKNPELKKAAVEKGLKETTMTTLHTIVNAYNLSHQNRYAEIGLLKQKENPEQMKEKLIGLLVNKIILNAYQSLMQKLEKEVMAPFNQDSKQITDAIKADVAKIYEKDSAEYNKESNRRISEKFDVGPIICKEKTPFTSFEEKLSSAEKLNDLKKTIEGSLVFKEKIRKELGRLTTVEQMQKYIASGEYENFAVNDPEIDQLEQDVIEGKELKQGTVRKEEESSEKMEAAGKPVKKAPENTKRKPRTEVYTGSLNTEVYKAELLRLIKQMQNTDSRMSTMKREYTKLSNDLKQTEEEFRDMYRLTNKHLGEILQKIGDDCNAYIESHKRQERLSSRQQLRLKVITRLLDLKEDFDNGCDIPNPDPEKALARKLVQNLSVYQQRHGDDAAMTTAQNPMKLQLNRAVYQKTVEDLQHKESFMTFVTKKKEDLPALLKVNGFKVLKEYSTFRKRFMDSKNGKDPIRRSAGNLKAHSVSEAERKIIEETGRAADQARAEEKGNKPEKPQFLKR